MMKENISTRLAGLSSTKQELVEKFLRGEITSANGAGGAADSASAASSVAVCEQDQRYEPFPLTDVQQAYWVGRVQGMALGNIAAHSYQELECKDLDLDRFNTALQRLVDRHEMLRAVVLPDGRQQVLKDIPPYRIEIVDARGQDSQRIHSQLSSYREDMSHQVRRPDQWPLFDIRAFQIDQSTVRLFISFDILLADIWSIRIISRELAELYENPDLELEPIEISFRDYVLAEVASRESAEYRRAYNYWISRIPSLPPAPELPLAVNPASISKPWFNPRTARLETELWAKLRAKANKMGLTPSGVLLAAFSDVLANWSKSPRFTINLTLFNRPPIHPQINQVVGDFTSLTFLEVDFSAVDTFTERAQLLQEQLWNDLEHRQVSGVQVLRELSKLHGRMSGTLMPVVFTSTLGFDTKNTDVIQSALDATLVYSISQTPQVWLDHQVFEQDGALVFNWDAVEALFPAGMLDEMFDAYTKHLRRLAEDEHSWEPTARGLTPAANLKQRAAINATQCERPDHLLQTMFAAQAESRPDQPAVISREATLSYGELYSFSNRIARRLIRGGAEVNRLVGVVMERGYEQVAAVLGTLASGAAYLPIEAGLPNQRIKYLLKDGEVRKVLTQRRVKERIEWPEDVEVVCVDGEEVAAESDQWAGVRQKSSDLAYVIYTSGTTGEPKGVMIDHRGAVNTILDINDRFAVTDQDAVLGLSSLSFDLSVYDIFGMLAAGGRLVIVEQESRRDPGEWMRKMKQNGVTIWNSVPAMMEMLMESDREKGELSETSLRLVMMSGDWIAMSLPERIKRAKQGVKVVSLGGATECSIWSVLYEVGEVSEGWKSIPYGKPMRNQRMEVRNEWGEAAPMWVSGEICIGGEGVARGYWKDKARTEEKFRTEEERGEIEYRTGDLGRYRADGNIELLGRKDDQVKVQGYRVGLVEIESELMKEEEIKRAAVVMEGEREGVKRLVGYIEMEEGEALRVEELREKLRKRLPEYMIPTAYEQIRDWPLSPTGKVDRKALPTVSRLASSRKPAPSSTPNGGQLGTRIMNIISSVLGVDSIDSNDNLLSWGANSVDLVRIANKLETEFGQRMGMEEFFYQPTIAAITSFYKENLLEHREYLDWVPRGGQEEARPDDKSYELLLDPLEREAFKKGQPGLRHDLLGKPAFLLPHAKIAEEAIDSFRQRRSHRKFLLNPVAFENLGGLLGALRQITLEEQPKYWYASAGGLYPVGVYLHVKAGRVDGLASGIYYYHPIEHTLIELSRNVELDRTIHGWENRPIFDQAAFSIFLVGHFGAIQPMYGELSRDFCMYEAGSMGQLLMMAAPDYEIGLCGIGGINFDSVRHLLLLKEEGVLLHTLLGGRIASSDKNAHELEGLPVQSESQTADQLLSRLKQLSKDEVRALLIAKRRTDDTNTD